MSKVECIMARLEKARRAIGSDVTRESCIGDKLIEQLEGQHFNMALEIGTRHGLSAMVLAHYAEVVITIDIERHPLLDATLAVFNQGLQSRICALHVRNDLDKRLLVSKLDFDMAFIDGQHTFAGAELDFMITQKCGRVLFHDYPCSSPDHRGVGLFVDSITTGTVTATPPFAWWHADGVS